MATFSMEEKERILVAFQRSRQLELLIAIPILAGTFTLLLLYRNPTYQIAGFGGVELALAAVAVLAVGLVLHFINWRCPACRRRLHRGVAGTPFCRGCGAVFVKDGKDPAKQGPAAERALQSELGFYQARAAKLFIGGLVLLGSGVAFLLFYSPGGTGPRNDLWLYRNFGESGLVWGARGTGVLMTLAGALMLYFAIRRLTVGVRAREASSRRVLGLTGQSSPPRPSRAGFLAAVLISILVIAALYYLSRYLSQQL